MFLVSLHSCLLIVTRCGPGFPYCEHQIGRLHVVLILDIEERENCQRKILHLPDNITVRLEQILTDHFHLVCSIDLPNSIEDLAGIFSAVLCLEALEVEGPFFLLVLPHLLSSQWFVIL